jgi:hypothetical protein
MSQGIAHHVIDNRFRWPDPLVMLKDYVQARSGSRVSAVIPDGSKARVACFIDPVRCRLGSKGEPSLAAFTGTTANSPARPPQPVPQLIRCPGLPGTINFRFPDGRFMRKHPDGTTITTWWKGGNATPAQATAVGASAFGNNAVASGFSSQALGTNSTASGAQATAIGSGSVASGVNGIAIGNGAVAGPGANTIAIGTGATALNSVAVGAGASASGGGAAFGDGATATGAAGSKNAAFGNGASATQSNSTAIGNGATTTRANQIVLGTGTNTLTAPGITSAASLAAQTVGAVNFTTTDQAGNLAQSAFGPRDIATLYSFAAGLSNQVNALQQSVRRAYGGTAVALALGGATALPDNKRFALSGNFGTFRGQTALGVAGQVRINEFVVVNGGVGVGLNGAGVGGRGGVTVAW